MNRVLGLALLLCLAVTTAVAQTASLQASASDYSAAGGTVTFTATVTYPSGGTPSAIGFAVNLPSGWGFVSQSLPSNATAVGSPSTGDTSLGWAFSGFPPGQLQWTFVASYPSGLTGTQTVSVDSTQSVYRPGAVALQAPDISFTPRLPAITSSTSASCVVNTSFSYTISASESPTSFTASGLPAGLSLDTSTGRITGTPSTSGTYSITISAANANGSGSTTTLTLTVGSLPEITSTLTANATAGSSFSYTITASNSANWFSASGLPGGLSINHSSGVISGTPSSAGTTNVTISADNDVGTCPSATLVITVAPNPNGGGTAPVITSQPVSKTVNAGDNVTFSVAATGATSYQWRKDGGTIAGATQASLTLTNVTTSNAGTYTVVVSNASLSTTSNGATLTVNSGASGPPSITTQPNAADVMLGGAVTFSVGASGSGLSYQWRRNGVAISGATGSTLTVSNTDSTLAGDYSVVITNSNGSVTSSVASLSVRSVTYFGTFGSGGGTFSLLLRPDRTGVFLGYAQSSKLALVSKDIVVDGSGHFGASISSAAALTGAFTAGVQGRPAIAASAATYDIAGAIGADGTISGSVSGLGLTLSAPAAQTAGSTSALEGFYESGAAGSSTTTYTIVGAAGQAYVAMVGSGTSDAGTATVDASGKLSATTANATTITGTVGTNALISLSATTTGATTPTVFSGGNNDARTIERLINISTRAVAGSGDATLIAGFTVNGTAPKRLLIRGIGPTLVKYGVGTALAHPKLQVFNQNDTTTPVAQSVNWSTSPDATAIAAAGSQIGAFPLASGSADAALLIYLQPGVYTAQVSSTDSATGVALIEVYEVP